MILLKNFSPEGTISGIQRIIDDEAFLLRNCTLSAQDLDILSMSKFSKRRLEILNVRFLIQELGLNISISYKDRKPYCENGFISISHSKSLVSFIWSPVFEYSIDIELVSSKLLAVSSRIFSEQEIDFAANDLQKLSLLWNCKECVYKIVNDASIEFVNDIIVRPFLDNEKIYVDLLRPNGRLSFEFAYGLILDHSFTYGKMI